MRSPIQWSRWRLSNFVEVRIRNVIDAENLNMLREDLTVLREDLTVLREDLTVLREDARSQSTVQIDLRSDFQSFRKEVSEDQRLPALESLIPEVISRLNNIDGLAQAANVVTQDLGARLDNQHADLRQLSSRIRANPFRSSDFELTSTRDGSSTIGFDGAGSGQYVDFVEAFRPTFDDLSKQLSYLSTWLPASGTGVDLGAGRGELVQLMQSHGLFSYGIDIDQSVVSSAVARGLDVRLSDIDSFLDDCPSSSLDVVTAIQVVEHVNTDQLVSWFGKIQRVLKPGGMFIAETPNPHAIDAFKAFWVDVTHVRPYYPESLLHMSQSAGFSRAEIWAPGEQDNITDRLEFAGSYTLIVTA